MPIDRLRPGVFIVEGGGLPMPPETRTPCMALPGLPEPFLATSLGHLVERLEALIEADESKRDQFVAHIRGIGYACANGATFPVQFVPEDPA